MSRELTAAWLIAELGLERHPEGGWYRQTFKDESPGGGRAFSTAIYFLLEGDDLSRWHRVDAAETWHYYAGAPLRLTISGDGATAQSHLLGIDFAAGQRPQVTVPKDHWQTARSLGDWTLVGCTVAPGFEFSGFELSEPPQLLWVDDGPHGTG
jgi:predicted cupin superfamily sugar epimerase